MIWIRNLIWAWMDEKIGIYSFFFSIAFSGTGDAPMSLIEFVDFAFLSSDVLMQPAVIPLLLFP